MKRSRRVYIIWLVALLGVTLAQPQPSAAAKKNPTPAVKTEAAQDTPMPAAPAEVPKNTAAPARSETTKNAKTTFQVNSAELNKLWFDALKLLENQKFADAVLKLTEVDLQKAETGRENLFDYSAVLLKYVNPLKQQRQWPEANKLLALAKQFSPDSAEVHFASAKLRLAQNLTDVYGAGQDLWHGLFITGTDFKPLVTYVNNGLTFLLVGGALTITVFILFAFAYYWRAIFFSFKTRLPGNLPISIINLSGGLLVGVITLTFGLFWGILFLAGLLLLQVDPAPKRILQAALLFGSLVAGLLIAVSTTFVAFDQKYFQALREVAYKDYSQSTVQVLQKRLQAEPDDDYALFGLAYILKNQGNFQDALAMYGKISGQYPEQAAVQNNIGNIYQIQFRQTVKKDQKDPALQQKAEEAYSSAINLAAKMFEPRYNIGQLLIYTKLGQSDDSEQQLAAASQFDAERFSRYSGYLQYNITTVDATFATWTLLKKLTTPKFLTPGLALAKRLWSSGSRFDNPWYFSAAAFGLLVISFVMGTGKGVPQSVNYCEMCGDPYLVKRKKSEEHATFCTQCTYIFKKKTTVKAEKRAEKIQQIQLRQKMRGAFAKIASICLPGAGQIYLGYLIKGVLIALLFDFALVIVLLKVQGGILLGSPDSSWMKIALSLLCLVGTYLFNLYDIYQLSPRNQ